MGIQFEKTAKIILLALAAIVGLFALVGLAVIFLGWPFARPIPYLVGLLVGGCLSGAKLFLLKRSLGKSIDMKSEDAKNVTRLSFVGRHLLTGVVLAGVVLQRQHINLVGTLLGIISLQLAAYVAVALERRDEKKRFAINGYPPPLPEEEEDDTEEDFPKFL